MRGSGAIASRRRQLRSREGCRGASALTNPQTWMATWVAEAGIHEQRRPLSGWRVFPTQVVSTTAYGWPRCLRNNGIHCRLIHRQTGMLVQRSDGSDVLYSGGASVGCAHCSHGFQPMLMAKGGAVRARHTPKQAQPCHARRQPGGVFKSSGSPGVLQNHTDHLGWLFSILLVVPDG